MNRFSLSPFLLIAASCATFGGIAAHGAESAPAMAAKPIVAKTNAAGAVAGDAWNTPLAGDQRVIHALNRLSFGPRPGDVAAVKKAGLNRWIEAQLNPGSIDDSALEKELKVLKLLGETPDRLSLAHRADQGNIRRFLQERAKVAQGKPATTGQKQPTVLKPGEQKLLREVEEAGFDPGTSAQALGELMAAKLARAIDSDRQLQEVLVDFWGNHFNLDTNKGSVAVLKITDDRDTIRPHVMGSFRELLGASAHSAAMMVYLDNARSTASYTNKRDKKTRGGLNENYGREIMELHTLGVDGGYTQKDVTEVARAFTGWGVSPGGEFVFRERAHDNAEKVILGVTLPADGGKKDGERVLDILAAHPATAQHIARRLCLRFVSDDPPSALVDRVAAAFTQSKGDLKATYRALFKSPEFNSAGAYRAKIKSPLEFAASAVRALDGSFALPDPGNPRQRQWLMVIGRSARDRGYKGGGQRPPLASEIANMGQPLWGYQAPTGYPEDSKQWVSSSALVARLNFALALTSGRIGDVALDKDTFRNASVEKVAANLLGQPLSSNSVATIEDQIKVTPGDGAKVRALILGSPEFQRK